MTTPLLRLLQRSGAPAARFCMLRQQAEKESDDPYACLADFVAPAQGPKDYLGAFAVGIFGGEAQYAAFAADHNDYKKIMLQVGSLTIGRV